MMRTWTRLESRPTDALEDARLRLHWAVQLLAVFGQEFGEPVSDDSHRSMYWDRSRRLLVTNGLHASSGLRLALQPRDLVLRLRLDEALVPLGEPLRLPGRTLREAYDWLGTEMTRLADVTPTSLTAPEYEMPPHSVSTGLPFDARDPHLLVELENWFHNASGLLSRVAADTQGASLVRCWPHHFDIATLVTLPDQGDGITRTVGMGMSPGDAYYRAPYFYVTPYPAPQVHRLPDLPVGRWHTDGWFGAVLTMSELLAEADAIGQSERARVFLRHAGEESSILLVLTAQGPR